MTTITPTLTRGPETVTIKWAGMATGDTINAASVAYPASHVTVHTFGTFGSATVALTGSLDGTNYGALLDHEGNAVSATAAEIEGLRTGALHYKPTISGGTDDSVTMIMVIWL